VRSVALPHRSITSARGHLAVLLQIEADHLVGGEPSEIDGVASAACADRR